MLLALAVRLRNSARYVLESRAMETVPATHSNINGCPPWLAESYAGVIGRLMSD
jgi:hypothetical protein